MGKRYDIELFMRLQKDLNHLHSKSLSSSYESFLRSAELALLVIVMRWPICAAAKVAAIYLDWRMSSAKPPMATVVTKWPPAILGSGIAG